MCDDFYLSTNIILTLHCLNFLLDDPQLFFKFFSFGFIGSSDRLKMCNSPFSLSSFLKGIFFILQPIIISMTEKDAFARSDVHTQVGDTKTKMFCVTLKMILSRILMGFR